MSADFSNTETLVMFTHLTVSKTLSWRARSLAWLAVRGPSAAEGYAERLADELASLVSARLDHAIGEAKDAPDGGLAVDLLSACLGRVDWFQIAERLGNDAITERAFSSGLSAGAERGSA